ncbi:MAG: bacillithiol system redox-active protein YtxJ [Bacillus sp. (in: Bacteria)]|nr:bacillithiol system redox-active protein YtxJ [Bacillus sp. (in: firmicutes)]
MSFRKVTTFEEFISLHEKYATFFLLKNSTTCPISHEAFKETEKYATENNEVPVFYLNVQESRPLSNEIADRYEVKHESPQLLLFHGNKVAWHESHWKVTKKVWKKHGLL